MKGLKSVTDQSIIFIQGDFKEIFFDKNVPEKITKKVSKFPTRGRIGYHVTNSLRGCHLKNGHTL